MPLVLLRRYPKKTKGAHDEPVARNWEQGTEARGGGIQRPCYGSISGGIESNQRAQVDVSAVGFGKKNPISKQPNTVIAVDELAASQRRKKRLTKRSSVSERTEKKRSRGAGKKSCEGAHR